jgi:short-subunit dehydrogenase
MKTVKPDLTICNLSRRPPDENICLNSGVLLNHFPCDLSRPVAVEQAAAAVIAHIARSCPAGRVLLINNSGQGAFGAFPTPDLRRQLELIDLNVRAVVHLTGLLLPLLRARGGAIINVASTIAYQPAPFAATYAASKSFVLDWSIALNEELRGTGVRAMAVCPGTTRTDFFRAAGVQQGILANLAMDSDAVASHAMAAFASGRVQVVPGWGNRIYTWLGARLPKPVAARFAARFLRDRRSGGTGS